MSEPKSWFSEKINRVDPPLAQLIYKEKRRKKIQVNSIRVEKENINDIKTGNSDIHKIIRSY